MTDTNFIPVRERIIMCPVDHEPIDKALNAIDEVHRDGLLPIIPVRREGVPKVSGRYEHINGKPSSISVHPFAKYPALTAIHELGHFIDHQGIGVRGKFASESSNLMERWRKAVEASETYGNLMNLTSGTEVVIDVEGHGQVSVIIFQKDIEYLQRYREIFARCYQQFIATQTEDTVVRDEFSGLVSSGYNRAHAKYWQKDDFGPIKDSLIDIFRQKGWIR